MVTEPPRLTLGLGIIIELNLVDFYYHFLSRSRTLPTYTNINFLIYPWLAPLGNNRQPILANTRQQPTALSPHRNTIQ
jgi:hypothetical protein